MTLPNDPVMLLSVVNTQLRDNYSSLEDMCQTLELDANVIIDRLASIDYHYDAKFNQFK